MRMERFWIRSVGSLLTFLFVLCTVALGFLWKNKQNGKMSLNFCSVSKEKKHFSGMSVIFITPSSFM